MTSKQRKERLYALILRLQSMMAYIESCQDTVNADDYEVLVARHIILSDRLYKIAKAYKPRAKLRDTK